MNENEKDKYLRKVFKIKDEIGVPPQFVAAYDVFEHMLGLQAGNGEMVPERLMALYKSAKGKSDSIRSGAELSHDVFVLLAVLHQALGVPKTPDVVRRGPGRPRKIQKSEVVTA